MTSCNAIELECTHSRLFTSPYPVLGEVIYCVRCDTYQSVTEAPNAFTVKCAVCAYNGGHAIWNSRENALDHAQRHIEKYPDHGIRMFNGKRKLGWLNYGAYSRRIQTLKQRADMEGLLSRTY